MILRVEGIVKAFPGIWEHLILDHVNFDLKAGEIHALLGENGAGKTVLANIISGFYTPSEGRIYVKGKLVKIRSPADAIRLGIGMVHQEFMLVRPFTVIENIALGLKKSSLSFPLSKVEKRIVELSEKYGLKIDPNAKVEELSAGEQQRVEILRVLFYEPSILILDEPTSLLSPVEVKELFSIMRNMAERGHGVIFITHKLDEVMEVSDRVTVLRLGKLVGTLDTCKTNRFELATMMFGKEVKLPRLYRSKPLRDDVVLSVKDVYVQNERGIMAVRGVSFDVRRGEIFGIVGIAGNGQKELVEAINGLRKVDKGKVYILGKDMTNKPPKEIIKQGVCHVPEERRRVGIAEGMSVIENLMMKDYKEPPFCKKFFLNVRLMAEHANKLVSDYEIMVPDLWSYETRILSGGHVQRLILARETWKKPELIIAAHPTYGLDLKALEHTHKLLMDLRNGGTSILLVTENLEEALSLSDRIGVMSGGRLVSIMDAAQAKIEDVGMMMGGYVAGSFSSLPESP